MWNTISRKISEATANAFVSIKQQSVGGGSINSAYIVSSHDCQYFVKINNASLQDMFQAERDGLNEIAQTNTIRVPKPICVGTTGNQAYIVLEYLNLTSGAKTDSQVRLARDLANMHQITQPQFGWHRDNTIGSTPQLNRPTSNWLEFWRNQRLGYQLNLAANNGYGGQLQRRGEQLLLKLDNFLSRSPSASLLHGDLWSGNYAFDPGGIPVLFDPATYYGDREADIAMTELFGGFSSHFYAAYKEYAPLDAGYESRKILYNLYHILNHLNLFGGGYLSQAQGMIDRLLSEAA